MKKTITTIAMCLLLVHSNAQKLPDSILLNTSEQKLGLHLQEKSKKQKTAGYLFAGVAVASFVAMPFVFENEFENNGSGAATFTAFCIGFGSTITSVALLSSGNKNAGKAQMLLRTKSPGEVPGYELDMGIYYKKKATRQRIIGFSLLAGGVASMIIATKQSGHESEPSDHTNEIVVIGGTVAMLASLPILIGAAKNKGRASVLLKKETIPFSYYSKPIGLNSIAVSIPLSSSR